MRSREVVSALVEYRSIADHALGALRAVLRTGIAPYYTIRDFYTALCTRDCLLCGVFGGFIFLPSFTRCCFLCIRSAPQFSLLSFVAVEERGISGPSLQLLRRSMPVLTTVPGIYSTNEEFRGGRVQIVARQHAAMAVVRWRAEGRHKNEKRPTFSFSRLR